ncbi:transporter substrate-binding domain-containing protein [Vibrio sp. SCSIO 43135]|nr:transporter substrate-binding domain-containing protein [Vibrio sp. SCSIO 43135]
MVCFRFIQLALLFAALNLSIMPLTAQAQSLSSLDFYTENYPPANFEVEGKVTGYAVDILVAASKAVGQEVQLNQIKPLPWARSYRATLTKPNAVLFSTTRTEHREELFRWVGPIADIKVVVLARKDAAVQIETPLDMANYKIGVIRDDIGEQSLLALGLPRDSMQEASYVTTLAEQLMKERIDLLAYAERAAYWWAKQAGIDSQEFEPVYVLKEGYIYYAFNKNIPQETLDDLQRGIDIIKARQNADGITEYQAILNKYR